ncbi:MAG: glycosyltransferase [Gammaproteobacteria bacterium]|nr:glycosyltransferase [Gammaproteobacteria bacterium]
MAIYPESWRRPRSMKRLKARAVKWTLGRVIHLARGVVAVSKGVADDLKLHFPFRENQLHVIHNPVITPATRQRLKEPLKNSPVPNGTPWMLYAGRFVLAKGLDVLMDAFELMADRTSAHLVLMGDGPIKSAIAGRAAANGLGERIHLVDFQLNPLPWMREAEVLVLSSRHEGLGNVLIEALACGTQIVATDCPAGPAEIPTAAGMGSWYRSRIPKHWRKRCCGASTDISTSPRQDCRNGRLCFPLNRRQRSTWRFWKEPGNDAEHPHSFS